MKLDKLRELLGDGTWRGLEEEWRAAEASMGKKGIDWSNLYQEVEMSSRYVDAHRDVTYAAGEIALHSHSFYELLLCGSNCGAEYLLGAERYRLQRGDVVFVPPGVSHRPILPERMEEPYRREVVWLSTEYMGNMQSHFPGLLSEKRGAVLLRTVGTGWEFIGERFHDLVREAEGRAPGWQACLAGNSAALLVFLQRMLEEKNADHCVAAEKPELLDRILAYIEDHLAEPITLTDTARRFWVSGSTVSQTFRQKMGVSFYHCVIQRRLIAAKSLIVQGVPLGEINERVGFADYSSFYRAFKGQYGLSPREFRAAQ